MKKNWRLLPIFAHAISLSKPLGVKVVYTNCYSFNLLYINYFRKINSCKTTVIELCAESIFIYLLFSLLHSYAPCFVIFINKEILVSQSMLNP